MKEKSEYMNILMFVLVGIIIGTLAGYIYGVNSCPDCTCDCSEEGYVPCAASSCPDCSCPNITCSNSIDEIYEEYIKLERDKDIMRLIVNETN